MYSRILIYIIFLGILLPGPVSAATVEVSITGLEPVLKENVLARLGLNLHRENPRLSENDIRRLHKQAEEDIHTALAPFGYYQPTIQATLDHAGEAYSATYTIAKGEPVRIENVVVKAEGPGKDADIFVNMAQKFPLQKGDILDQGRYEIGKKAIIRLALRYGFMKAGFTVRELRIDRTAQTAEIHLVLATGPQFVFGETLFDQDELSPKLLQQYLPYKKGEPYRPAKLFELQKVLYRTEYFTRVVVEGQVDKAEQAAVPIVVRPTLPELRNRYSVGLGYATDTGARARLQWRNKLLNAEGHRVRSTAQLSERDSSLGLNYEIPFGNPSDDRIALRTSFHDQAWQDTNTKLFTIGGGLEHRGTYISHGGTLEYRDEKYSIGSTEGESRLLMPSFSGTFIWADDLLDTNYGLELSFSVSGASKDLGSDTNFLKGVAGGKIILGLMPRWRLIGRATLGGTAVDSIDELPPSLRFYAGGDQSIRGFGYKELGTEDESGAVVGGRYLLIGSAEIEREVTEKWSLAAFWDVGNAVDDLSIELKQGVGLGVRYRVPFGQIRLDLASAVLEDGSPLRLHLTVGADL